MSSGRIRGVRFLLGAIVVRFETDGGNILYVFEKQFRFRVSFFTLYCNDYSTIFKKSLVQFDFLSILYVFILIGRNGKKMYCVLNVLEYNSFLAPFEKFKENLAFRYHNENMVL